MKYRTPTGKKKWHESTIRGILKNEKYKGDVLQGKTYTTDPIRYKWTQNQEKEFIEKYFLKVSKESNLMSGFIGVYNLLKEQGHEFVVITARGGFVKEVNNWGEVYRYIKELNNY